MAPPDGADERGAAAALKCSAVAGYACLVAVNAAASAGTLGATNAQISGAYPTMITPAGFTFAIWGPIFLLQGMGTLCMASESISAKATAAVVPGWLAAWLAECAWQFVFCRAPPKPALASPGEKLRVLGPAAALLLAAQGGMLAAAVRLRAALAAEEPGEGAVLRAVAVDFPTGLNAGWLAAASGIGLTLVAQQVPALAHVATPQGGAALLAMVSAAGGAATLALGDNQTPGLGLGYASATAWACYGITQSTAPPAVKSSARLGAGIAAVAALISIISNSRREKWKGA